jgi:hypothetical protein
MLYRVHLAWVGFELKMLVVIGTDCIASYKEKQFSYKIQFGISHAQIIYRTSADISRRNLCFNLSTYCDNNFYLELDF